MRALIAPLPRQGSVGPVNAIIIHGLCIMHGQ